MPEETKPTPGSRTELGQEVQNALSEGLALGDDPHFEITEESARAIQEQIGRVSDVMATKPGRETKDFPLVEDIGRGFLDVLGGLSGVPIISPTFRKRGRERRAKEDFADDLTLEEMKLDNMVKMHGINVDSFNQALTAQKVRSDAIANNLKMIDIVNSENQFLADQAHLDRVFEQTERQLAQTNRSLGIQEGQLTLARRQQAFAEGQYADGEAMRIMEMNALTREDAYRQAPSVLGPAIADLTGRAEFADMTEGQLRDPQTVELIRLLTSQPDLEAASAEAYAEQYNEYVSTIESNVKIAQDAMEYLRSLKFNHQVPMIDQFKGDPDFQSLRLTSAAVWDAFSSPTGPWGYMNAFEVKDGVLDYDDIKFSNWAAQFRAAANYEIDGLSTLRFMTGYINPDDTAEMLSGTEMVEHYIRDIQVKLKAGLHPDYVLGETVEAVSPADREYAEAIAKHQDAQYAGMAERLYNTEVVGALEKAGELGTLGGMFEPGSEDDEAMNLAQTIGLSNAVEALWPTIRGQEVDGVIMDTKAEVQAYIEKVAERSGMAALAEQRRSEAKAAKTEGWLLQVPGMGAVPGPRAGKELLKLGWEAIKWLPSAKGNPNRGR
jgi:hypothetical protein